MVEVPAGGIEGPKNAVALPLDSVRRRPPSLMVWVRVRAEETLDAFMVRRRPAGDAADFTEDAEEFDDVRERFLERVPVREWLLEGKLTAEKVGETAAEKTGVGEGAIREKVGT